MGRKKLVVVATSPAEYARLEKTGVLDNLAEAFGADYHLLCSDIECFKNQASYAHGILYTDSFEASYPEVYRYAAASWTVNKMVRILHRGNEILVKGNYKTRIIDNENELKEALNDVIDKGEITGEQLKPILAAVALIVVMFALIFGSFRSDAKEVPVVSEPTVILAPK